MSEKCVYCGADLGYTGASLHVCDKLMDRGYEGGYQDGYRAGKAEQDREIERLRVQQEIDADIHLEELLDQNTYQRRHRKWALKECRTWQRHFCFYKDDAVRFHSVRADKAEARIAGLEQELLWAVDACEKAEAGFAQLQRYNDVLKDQRMDIYNEGAEDGKMEAVADLRNLTPGGSEFQTIDECIKWIRDRLSTRAKQTTDNRRLQERVKQLEEGLKDIADHPWNKPIDIATKAHQLLEK